MKQPKQSTRRTRARRGIYYRLGSDGKRHYEITFTDSEGRQRWQAVEGSIEDAEQARSDVLGRKRKGAKIAPRKQTFKEAGESWLARQTSVRPRTREAYSWALRVHLNPRFGRMQVAAIGEDEIAAFIVAMQKRGLSGWTQQGALKPLRAVLNSAARSGQIAENPMHRLERSERPRIGKTRVKVLDREQTQKVLAAAESARDRTLLAVAVFTGLRIAELCGLTWADVDTDASVIRVRWQLERDSGKRVEVKTDEGQRDVRMMPAVTKLLRTYKVASRHSKQDDFVFPTYKGAGLDQTVARRALRRALKGAGMAPDHLTFHGLRHTFASILIAQGEDIGWVSGQLGHTDSHTTLRTYQHLIDARRHADEASARMEADYGKILESSGGNDPQNSAPLRAVESAS